VVGGLHACIARDEGSFEKQTSDDAGKPDPVLIEGGPGPGDAKGDVPATDPHAVLGVEPPHGPFNGGQLALVRGNGFSSEVRVWFGNKEIAAGDITPVDPKRVQIVVPPGPAGPVDVTVQNGSDNTSARTLTGAYTYDAFYASPASGPTSGGTIITLSGQDTQWTAGTEVFVDLKPCEDVSVASETELTCRTPPAAAGVKTIRVVTPDLVQVDVLDAFTYGDSDNGFKGGLSGQPLKDEITVLTLDGYTGDPVPSAFVIAGSDVSSDPVVKTDGKGVAVIQAPGLGPKRTITVAKKCYQPVTFVDVPVDTVTAYIDPVLSPKCAEDGDPPPTGGSSSLGANVSGELVWPSSKEFERSGWTNVPPPKGADEELVAYVFDLSSDPTDEFYLPSSFSAVTPDSPGTAGFAFNLGTGTGNQALYALAGIENRAYNPPLFSAYAMGVVSGVSTKPGGATGNVFIKMDVPLDHALSLTAPGPSLTPKGPDRLLATVAIRVGEQGYALLPHGRIERLLPSSAPIKFVGVPPLIGSLAGTQYVVSASAVTGVSQTTPISVAGLLATTTTAAPISVGPFVEVPELTLPDASGSWNAQDLSWTWPAGGQSVDLSILEIESGSGLVVWTVAAPAGVQDVQLPDLALLSGDLSLISGPITVFITAAHIDAFDYGSLRYRELREDGWNAHARDVFYTHL
jgi:hypothetical protein